MRSSSQLRLHAFAHPEETEHERDEACKDEKEQKNGPPGFVPDREHGDLESGRDFVPLAIAIGSP